MKAQRQLLSQASGRRTRAVTLLVSLAGMLMPPPAARADTPSPWRAGAGVSVTDFGYKEFDDDGRLLDREDGVLPGIVLGVARTSGGFDLGGRLAYHSGGVTYDGQTNTGIPVTTDTSERVVQIEVRGAYRLSDDDRFAVYGGLGYRYWSRDIASTRTASGLPVNGLKEIYDWWLGFVGAEAALNEGGRSRWRVDVRALRIVAPQLRVDVPGSFDRARLDLGERYGVRLSLPWRYRWDDATDIGVEPYAEGWTLGRSPTVPLTRNGLAAGTINEPRSEQRNYGVTFELNRRF